MNKTPLVLIEVEPQLRYFLSVLQDERLPTADVEAALDTLADVTCDLSDFHNKLHDVAFDMGAGEQLFEKKYLDEEMDGQIQEKIIHSAYLLGDAIKDKLLELQVYVHDRHSYKFKGVHLDSCLLFSDPSSELAPPNHALL